MPSVPGHFFTVGTLTMETQTIVGIAALILLVVGMVAAYWPRRHSGGSGGSGSGGSGKDGMR